jgi:alpha-L-fucosidase
MECPWSRITYEEVPFREIYEHIKSLQPDCLLCDLTPVSTLPVGSTIPT